MDPRLFGHDSWATLHAVSLKHDLAPDVSVSMSNAVQSFVNIFPRLVQCVVCRYPATDFHQYLEGVPPTNDETIRVVRSFPGAGLPTARALAEKRLFERSVRLHNMVNKKISMQRNSLVPAVFELEAARRLWTGNLQQTEQLERHVWSYITIVLLHYNGHGEKDKFELYRVFVSIVPLVLALLFPHRMKGTTMQKLTQFHF